MELSISSSSVGDGSLRSAIEYCKGLEVDRLVVSFDQVPGFQKNGYLDVTALKGVKREIEDAGMAFSVMQVKPQDSMIAGAPLGGMYWTYLCRSLEAMGQVGADVLSVFITRNRPQDPAEVDAAWGRFVEFYRKFMAQAEQCGVKVALHPCSKTAERPNRDLVYDYDTMSQLMREAPSPSNGVCFCVGNFWVSAGEGIYDVIRTLGDKVFHVHARSTRRALGETPFWLGDPEGPDFRKLIQALQDVGYTRELSPEHLPHVAGENRAETGTAFVIGFLKALLQPQAAG